MSTQLSAPRPVGQVRALFHSAWKIARMSTPRARRTTRAGSHRRCLLGHALKMSQSNQRAFMEGWHGPSVNFASYLGSKMAIFKRCRTCFDNIYLLSNEKTAGVNTAVFKSEGVC